jgi:C-terminal processing protease CtpA/Prc
MGLNCNECGVFRPSPKAPPKWVFNDLPQIYYVDPGSPADKAGLRRDDVLIQIDGMSLLTEEAGRKFGAVRPGQAIRWTYRRGGDTRSVVVVAKRRPDSEETMPLLDLRDELKLLKEEMSAQEMNRGLDELAARIDRMSFKTSDDVRQRLRYSGVVGASEVEVRGLGTVAVVRG